MRRKNSLLVRRNKSKRTYLRVYKHHFPWGVAAHKVIYRQHFHPHFFKKRVSKTYLSLTWCTRFKNKTKIQFYGKAYKKAYRTYLLNKPYKRNQL